MTETFKTWEKDGAYWWALVDHNGKPRAICVVPHARAIDRNNEIEFVRSKAARALIQNITKETNGQQK